MSISISNPQNPREIVSECALRILKRLDYSDSVKQQTELIIGLADKQGLLAKANPKYLAGGIVCIAGNLAEERMTTNAVGGGIGASSSTVSRYYVMIARDLGFSER